MKDQDLAKLNLDELETELEKGSFSKSFLDSLLEAEKAGKNRSGAVELIEDAIGALGGDSYAVAQGQSIGFRAGIKTGGEAVDLEWPEFKENKALIDSMLERGLVVKQ